VLIRDANVEDLDCIASLHLKFLAEHRNTVAGSSHRPS
jgi:hypothetical protein